MSLANLTCLFALASLPVFAQRTVDLDESKIRVDLSSGPPRVRLPIVNTTPSAIDAALTLAWLSPADIANREATRTISLQPGSNTIELPLPFTEATVWTRLRYSLAPRRGNAAAFLPISGVVALPLISPHVFELSAVHIGVPRWGQPLIIHASAIHPITRTPVSGLQWTATLELDSTRLQPTAVSADGLQRFTFNLPAPPENGDSGDATIEIKAALGGFEQTASLDVEIPARYSAHFQTDKPIYQPGHLLHARAVAFDPLGRAAAGAAFRLVVESPDNEPAHTARVTASAFGVVHLDWAIPASAPLGAWRIHLTADAPGADPIATHTVRVSRYDLPSFRVQATPVRPAFLPTDTAAVDVSAAFLFGKPVAQGRVRIIRDDGDERPVAEGPLSADGRFSATLNLAADHAELARTESLRFRDLHLSAFVTDAVSGRTEQRRFDLRISRQPIHLYVLDTLSGPSLFVSASYADGRPAQLPVQLTINALTTTIQTNRYGLAKIDRPAAPSIRLAATTPDGLAGDWEQTIYRPSEPSLLLATPRTLFRPGQPVTLAVTAAPHLPAAATVLVQALAGGRRVASQSLTLNDRRGQLTFPFQPEFEGVVVFAAWSHESSDATTRAVVFPASSGLSLTASSARPVYRPGETATLTLRATGPASQPVQAALGVAVVDKSVLERARTDAEFGPRPWFACLFCDNAEQSEIAGIRLDDLLRLNPARATPELDLVAEALAARAVAQIETASAGALSDRPPYTAFKSLNDHIKTAIDRHLASGGDFPRDQQAFLDLIGHAWSEFRDPWLAPYSLSFGVDGPNRTIALISSGPDKRPGTADDFTPITVARPYFTAARHLIDDALLAEGDFPPTPAAFERLLNNHGLNFATLRDPWNTPFRAIIDTFNSTRRISILSAGPDRAFSTPDDTVVAIFAGPYFTRTSSAIAAAAFIPGRSPRSLDDFRAALAAAHLDIETMPDAWGTPYSLHATSASEFGNRRETITFRLYGQPSTNIDRVTPVTLRLVTFSVRSAGPDLKPATADDFDIIRFPVVVETQPATPAPLPLASQPAGALFGVVVDATGALVPNATITVTGAGARTLTTRTGPAGRFEFPNLQPGAYTVSAEMPGFRKYEIAQVPVVAHTATDVLIELEVGSVSESVIVSAQPTQLQTESAASLAIVSTPPVRDYFPETLYWAPNTVTARDGLARIQLPLPGSITTWTLAAFASTPDGRTSETTADFRAFQPFFLELDPPPTLTEGDSIELPVTVRNYLDRPQPVAVSLAPNTWAQPPSPPAAHLSIPASGAELARFPLRALRPAAIAPLRFTATSPQNADAIEKSLEVRPNGQRVVQSLGGYVAGPAALNLAIHKDAIPGASRAELVVYPNLAALLLESAEAILVTPHGCAEQTTSAGYANLAALRFLSTSGLSSARLQARALANIRQAALALRAFQSPQGGLAFWPRSAPDAAVTAHALHFLLDAAPHLPDAVDFNKDLALWLAQSQSPDGLWTRPALSLDANLLLTATVAAALARAQHLNLDNPARALTKAYAHLARAAATSSEPYLIAQFILAAIDSANPALAQPSLARLVSLAQPERDGLFWHLSLNTPFYGWGLAGRLEASALAVNALAAWRASHPADTHLDPLIRGGVLFIMRHRDARGAWHSTQATLRAMAALTAAAPVLGGLGASPGSLEIRAADRLAARLRLTPDTLDPIRLDLSSYLTAGDNRIDVIPSQSLHTSLVRLTATHYVPWPHATPRTAAGLSLNVAFSQTEAPVGRLIHCTVTAQRTGFRGYGMMLAEIGLPPGADVDRASLERLLVSSAFGLNHYEIHPDRVVLYLWPQSARADLRFSFTLRFPIDALSQPSRLFDYYNPDSLSETAPTRFIAR